jgi:hypothetical protein
MARKRKNKHGVPRAKRMKRCARLQSAVSWLRKFESNNVLRSYCKNFGVDWRCAAIELTQLGIQIDRDYLEQRQESERQVINERRRRREARTSENPLLTPIEYESLFDAYLAEDFAALHAMECERDGIDPETGLAVSIQSRQVQLTVRRNRD